ncbi:hypothetical protein [Alicyclobacillus sp.]|nr:hypothetical protein [Alicyclobacillus sp.]MCL6517608.1 hypothetical protein [Alicyclobacillus sp.]
MQERKSYNPIQVLEKVWHIAERVTVTLASLLVIGTAGYVSFHLLT